MEYRLHFLPFTVTGAHSEKKMITVVVHLTCDRLLLFFSLKLFCMMSEGILKGAQKGRWGGKKRKMKGERATLLYPVSSRFFCVRTFLILWTRLSQSLEQARGIGTKRWPIQEYFFFYLAGLRLLAVGRNQYIELMNTCRSSKV